MNIIDQTLLTPKAVNAWQQKAIKETAKLKHLKLEEIGIEKAKELPDGYLLIYCEYPGGQIEMKVAPEDWSYISNN